MNRKIGMYSSAINFIAVVGFAISMLLGFNFGSYFSSMFIALSCLPMMCAYAHYAKSECKTAGYTSAAFCAMYAAIILLVYFAQLTTVRQNDLTRQAIALLDFQRFGLFFNYDMLGYALMALATFFAGLTVKIGSRSDKWLKSMLMIHGVFFISCLVFPMLDILKADGQSATGVIILEFWCLYFCPISVLSFIHFSKWEQ